MTQTEPRILGATLLAKYIGNRRLLIRYLNAIVFNCNNCDVNRYILCLIEAVDIAALWLLRQALPLCRNSRVAHPIAVMKVAAVYDTALLERLSSVARCNKRGSRMLLSEADRSEELKVVLF